MQIKSATGKIVECLAINHIEIHTETEEELKKGHQVIGDVVENPEQIQKAIKGIAEGAIGNDETRKHLINLLLEREDKGFAHHAEYFNVDPLNRSFSYLVPCGGCQGQGQTTCNRCSGNGQETCTTCHGRTMMPCTYCHSTGYTPGQDGRQIQCNRCFGQRQLPCSYCRRTGITTCQQCRGTGTAKCSACKGGAVNTQVVHFRMKMKTLFEIDRAELPDPVIKVIETQGPKMAEKGHIKLHAEALRKDDGNLAIQYTAVFPYGDIEFSINGKPLKAHLFGYKGKLLKVPNFLDQLVAANMQNLADAANNPSKATSKIKKARQSRLISNGLVCALSYPSKKAVLGLKKKFPFGASNELLKDTIILSNKALGNVTQKTFMGGLILGAVVTAALNAAYFMTPMRDLVSSIFGPNAIFMFIDLLLVPIGGFIGASAARHMAKRPLKKALGSLMPAKFKGGKLNKTWSHYVTSFVVFLIVIFIAKIMGHNIPLWFPF